jgi:signal transduction histidine kinase
MVDGVQPVSPETLRPVLGQIERLGRLVDQLLDLSRLEAGVIPFASERVSVKALVDDVAHAASLRTGTDAVRTDVPVTLFVRGDADRLRQVVANLVDNALRHAPGDDPVTVTASAESTPEPMVKITVSDNGPGIPHGDAARVFDRFTRLDSARSSNDGGAGLGLSIVQWIVELHHGSISVEQIRPAAPHGCRMVVRLPASTA